MQRTTVLLLFGGESSEHDVSVSSARNVYAAIDDEKYEVLLGYIDPQGRWWLLDMFGMQIDTHGAPQLLPALGGRGFVTMPDNRVIAPDVILPILHGKNGEDGSVQGLAQLTHIPIVGADMTASATAMDKLACKERAALHYVPVVPYEVHRHYEAVPDFNKLSMALGCPVFVKPARAGSSMGVSKVSTEDELVQALKDAHRHDDVVLIEQAITARELEVGIIGTGPDMQATSVGEVKSGDEYYTYEAKYSSGETALDIPAVLEEDIATKIQAMAKKVYRAVGCNGLARVDFFLSDDGRLYFNELNTMPGFTNTSMFPKLWRQEGVSYPELIERLLSNTLGHGTMKAEITEEE